MRYTSLKRKVERRAKAMSEALVVTRCGGERGHLCNLASEGSKVRRHSSNVQTMSRCRGSAQDKFLGTCGSKTVASRMQQPLEGRDDEKYDDRCWRPQGLFRFRWSQESNESSDSPLARSSGSSPDE